MASGTPRFRAALFDLDGTLVESLDGIVATVDAVLVGRGLAASDPTAVRRLVGAPLEEIFRTLCADQTGDDWVAECVEGYRQLYPSLGIPRIHMFDGVREVLAACARAGTRVGLVTTKRTGVARDVLVACGVAELFDVVIGGDATPRGKPHPDPVLAALARLGVAPEDAAMVGDTTFDVEMARAAGCLAVAVTWGYHPVELLTERGAQRVVSRVRDLITLLAPGADAPANG